jgi:hypothetical protein
MPGPYPAPISDATSTRRGLMGIGAQVFSGVKTFLDAIKLSIKTTGTLPAGGAELEGSVVYDTTTKRPRVHNGTTWQQVVMDTGTDPAASLAEHIANVHAHNGDAIDYTGGSTMWANTSPFNPDTVDNAFLEIVDGLANTGGASRVGATSGGGLATNTVQGQINEVASRPGLAAIATGGGDGDLNWSSNRNAYVSRTGVGVYTVTFTGVTIPSDSAVPVTLSVLNTLSPRCIVGQWTTPGSVLTVRTFNLSGIAVDEWICVTLPHINA